MPQKLRDRQEIYKLVPHGGIVAELGVEYGYNASLMLWCCQPRELWMIDGWIAYAEQGTCFDAANQERIYAFVAPAAAAHPACRILRTRTHDAAAQFTDGYFDFVYVDASHRYADVKQDIEDWWPKVKVGGILAGHDYHGEIAVAVNERFPSLDYLSGDSPMSWGVIKR